MIQLKIVFFKYLIELPPPPCIADVATPLLSITFGQRVYLARGPNQPTTMTYLLTNYTLFLSLLCPMLLLCWRDSMLFFVFLLRRLASRWKWVDSSVRVRFLARAEQLQQPPGWPATSGRLPTASSTWTGCCLVSPEDSDAGIADRVHRWQHPTSLFLLLGWNHARCTQAHTWDDVQLFVWCIV